MEYEGYAACARVLANLILNPEIRSITAFADLLFREWPMVDCKQNVLIGKYSRNDFRSENFACFVLLLDCLFQVIFVLEHWESSRTSWEVVSNFFTVSVPYSLYNSC
ncbi:hypothetical protein ACOME3_003515 [Neoechinorhynchus agilis]